MLLSVGFSEIKKTLLLVWLALMFVIPKEYGLAKGFILLCICILSFIYILREKKINIRECGYFFCFIVYFLSSILYGVVSGWKFDITQDYPLFFYYVFTPICVFLFGYLYQNNKIFIVKICICMTAIISFLDLIRIFMILGILPKVGIIDFIVRVDSENTLMNELTLRISNESSLIFLLPLNILFLTLPRDDQRLSWKYKIGIVLASVLGSGYAMLSGRRILEIGVLIAWLIVCSKFLLQRFSVASLLKGGIFVGAFLLIISYIFETIASNSDLSNLSDMIINTFFEGFTGAGMQNRQSYIPGLIELWETAPIFGHGLNAYGNVLANWQTLWSYEVVFLALLGQAGIIGVFIILLGVFFVLASYFNIYKSTKSNWIKALYKAMAVASVIFVLAGLSNPQVYYAWFWGIFFTFSKVGEYDV